MAVSQQIKLPYDSPSIEKPQLIYLFMYYNAFLIFKASMTCMSTENWEY